MNREIHPTEGNADEGAGMFSGNDRPEEDGEVDDIVMELAIEKIKGAVVKK